MGVEMAHSVQGLAPQGRTRRPYGVDMQRGSPTEYAGDGTQLDAPRWIAVGTALAR